MSREIGRIIGARFITGDDGKVNFVYGIDASNMIGPRPATEADKANHVGAWNEFLAALGSGPLDGDGDGSKGGSLPGKPRGRPKKVKAVDAPDDHTENLR